MWSSWTTSALPAVDVAADSPTAITLPVEAADGHRWQLLGRLPARVTSTLLWLPALGVAARHYLPFADALAARGIAVFIHEWRGHGSSSLRAGRQCDWGYQELLTVDLPASESVAAAHLPAAHRTLGGHSLGGQLACCRLALAPGAAGQLWLVASGAPYWRAFPLHTRYLLLAASRLLPWLANRHGALPGRRIGFGGSESRGVIRDWARTARTGHYAVPGLDADLEAALGSVTARVRGVLPARDWLAPIGSLQHLLAKMPRTDAATTAMDAVALGCAADHFAWMKHPEPLADLLTR